MGKSVSGIRLAAAALLLAPLLAHAAGLGRLTVLSALGQPLSAEIEIVSLQSGEEDSLNARLATPEAFRQAGIELSPALLGVQFSIERRAGRPIVRLRSFQPVNEPFLDLLVELQWATGRLVREYTFLLDPPEYKGPQPIAAAPAPAPAARPAPEPAPAKPAPRVEARPLAAAPAAAAGSYEVIKGDTLGAIARRNKPEGVTLNQMMIALFRANQAAFIRGNINLVRAGRILNIPDRDAITGVDTAEANGIVRSHMAEFTEYKSKLAAVVASAPAVAAPREREVTGKIAPKPTAPAPGEPKDQLMLSKADPAKPGAPGAREAREDDRVARGRALKDAQSRVNELEKIVTEMQKLLEMKNQQLAELEKKAAEAKPAHAATAAKAPEPPKPAPDKPAAEPAKPAAVAKAPEAAKAPETKAAAEPAKPEAPKPVAEAPKPAADEPKPATEAAKAPDAPKPVAEAPKPAPEAAKPKPKPVAAPPPPPPPPSIIDEFLDDPIALGALGGLAVLLVGYGAWAWRRKKATQTKFQDSVLGAASAPGAAAVPAAGVQPAAAGAVESQVSVSGAAAPGAAEGDEVDPIAEADVYMAYGRDAQAEEILKESLGKDPSRVPVHAKLLEIYANRRDKKSFEQTALKLRGLTNGTGSEWDKATALGRSIDPRNGLYGGAAAVAGDTQALPGAPAAPAPALDFDLGGGTEPGAGQVKADTTGSVDFDLGATTTTAAALEKTDFAPSGTLIMDQQEAKAASSGLDFDLGGGEAAKKPEPAATAPADSSGSIDFDLNIDLGGAKAEAPVKPAAEPALDLGSISLDLGGTTPGAEAPGAGGTDQKWQEVATKLDLAKAYLEMDDKDGARELLNEVLKEGDAAQQSQAKQMLANLG